MYFICFEINFNIYDKNLVDYLELIKFILNFLNHPIFLFIIVYKFQNLIL